ncbi:UDP-glucosyltransferase 2-like isoform X2 [Daktulosphaira vitifoliae]|nr:UDP-glucosyltransferase 2-like isoform X2 [Daktulosphaira vitifoliae]XP_050519784.1 UDP-glucosyltransferase 2-like isoform X2 [Daktulosphaira vitifoliae]
MIFKKKQRLRFTTQTLIVLFLICFHGIELIESANILVFTPSPWKSHVVSFEPLFFELSNRGHNVTIVTKFPAKNPPPNYNQVVVTYDFDASNFLMKERGMFFFLLELYLRDQIAAFNTNLYLSSKDIQAFIKEDKSRFDLVILESFYQECTVSLGHKYDAPVINLIPVPPWTTTSQWAANPSDISYIKDFVINAGKLMNFHERCINTIYSMYNWLIEPISYFSKMENTMNKYFQYAGFENRPSMKNMLKNVSLNLVDSDVMILSPRPYVPSFIEVSGIHIRPTKSMSKELKDFMDNATSGVIYFNFGTILNVTDIPKDSFDSLVTVLGRLNQKIIFKWINKDTSSFPNNFYVDSWLPQMEILNHSNCRLFITHGGVHGLIESLLAGVPIIGFPVFGDQFVNIRATVDDGYGIIGNIFHLTEKKMENYVNRILTDKKYSENAKRVSAIFRDKPMSAVDKAIYWVEYVIRHNGAHNLKTAAVHLPWYQYYLIDVIVLMMSIVVIIIYFVSLMCKCLKKLLVSFIKNKQKKL